MPKKAKKVTPAKIVKKLLLFPADWVDRIDRTRGEMSFADFVRNAILQKIDRRGLSEMPGWGKGRWKDDSIE